MGDLDKLIVPRGLNLVTLIATLNGPLPSLYLTESQEGEFKKLLNISRLIKPK